MLSSSSIVVTRWSVNGMWCSGWFAAIISQRLAHDHAAIACALPLGVFNEPVATPAVPVDQVKGGLCRVEGDLARAGGPRHVLDGVHQPAADAALLQRRLDRGLAEMRPLGLPQPWRTELPAGRLEKCRANHVAGCVDGHQTDPAGHAL